MPGNASPNLGDTPISVVTSPGRQTRGSLPRVLRAAAYWVFGLWLAFVQWLNVGELIQYYFYDPETYRRVYRDPEFYLAMMWTWSALFSLAVGLQAIGWRKRRVSLIAMTISAAFVCYLIANVTFGIHKICCG